MGELYSKNSYTLSRLATIYGINRNTLSDVMIRGIATNIFSDELAQKVYAKVLFCCKSKSTEIIKSYEAAFEARDSYKQTS